MFEQSIMVDDKLCTGCRGCEIACSFYFEKVFRPSKSAIKVMRDAKTGRSKVEITNSCNVCSQELTPLCILACAPKALSLGRQKKER